MNLDASYLALFLMGLMSSAHCIGMCGGIATSLSMAIPADHKKKAVAISIAYNLGRILSYTVFGAIFGFIAQQIGDLSGIKVVTQALRIFAGLLLIATGFYIAQWWMGLNVLEKIGAKLWLYVQPLSKKILPVKTIHQGFLLGCVWGWLPCGMVYAALALAVTHANASQSALSMLAFGLGTFPAVVSASIFSAVAVQSLKTFLQNKTFRTLIAIGFILLGVWTIYVTIQPSAHHHGHTTETETAPVDHTHMHH